MARVSSFDQCWAAACTLVASDWSMKQAPMSNSLYDQMPKRLVLL